MTGLQVGNDAEQDLRIGFRKAGGRFVKDQKTRLTNQAFANLDQLLLPDSHVPHDDVGVEMQVELPENLCRLLLELFPVHEGAGRSWFHPEEDVLRDREVGRKVQFLVNDGNSGANYSVACPNYFRTMGIPILKGREFTKLDTLTGPGVIVIQEWWGLDDDLKLGAAFFAVNIAGAVPL